MQNERNSSRFDDIGRFEAFELCALPGSLVNISREGCKIRYDFPVIVDLDNDYEAAVTFARAASNGQVRVLCHPVWVQTVAGKTEIGFKILPSLDYSSFLKYVKLLDDENDSIDLEDELQGNVSVCKIIK